ncbi:MAG: PAS domain-containing protein, partial [Candidatus Sulfotelmatobacter sp.]
ITMSTATPFPWSELSVTENAETGFRSIFERAPIAAARCNPEGVIIEMNPAFEQALDPDLANQQILRLCDLVPAEDRDTLNHFCAHCWTPLATASVSKEQKEEVPQMGWQ